jgi:cytochrome oxidase assembly protein ShyY1
VNIGLSILIVTPLFNALYPFIRDTNNNRGVVLLILMIGIGLGVWSLRRLHLIRQDKDRFYSRLLAYQATLHK